MSHQSMPEAQCLNEEERLRLIAVLEDALEWVPYTDDYRERVEALKAKLKAPVA